MTITYRDIERRHAALAEKFYRRNFKLYVGNEEAEDLARIIAEDRSAPLTKDVWSPNDYKDALRQIKAGKCTISTYVGTLPVVYWDVPSKFIFGTKMTPSDIQKLRMDWQFEVATSLQSFPRTR